MSKINSKKKGSEYELKIAKTLSKWWGEEFHRTPMSGGLHWARDNRVAGDIVTPPNSIFPYSVECKKRESWSLDNILKGTKSEDLEEYWEQCTRDAEEVELKPLVIFSKNFNPDYIMMEKEDFPDKLLKNYIIIQKEDKPMRIICRLDEFLDVVSKDYLIELYHL